MADKQLRQIGERKAINIIESILSNEKKKTESSKYNLAVGIGDDCAALDFGNDYLLITTDMINVETHIPKGATPWQIGWHIIAINLSDIAAKGGNPVAIVVSLGLPKDYAVSSFRNLAEGMRACTRKYNVVLAGGDTKENKQLTMCGTAIGVVPKENFMPRRGAKIGDIVAVTGKIGSAAAGYYMQKRNIAIKWKTSSELLLEKHPRIKEGVVLGKTMSVTSSIDMSDGLASSIYQLSAINGVGFEIDSEKIPASKEARIVAKKSGVSLQELTLYFGGDYELLVTVKKDRFEKVKKEVENCKTKFTPIGRVVRGKKNTIIINGKRTTLKNKGYEHFKK
ncbi:MAG: thiamine-phosphate kinase [Thermoplasmata archaeon]